MTPAFQRRASTRLAVARQYCGQLGKQDNCQVAVSLSLANETASLPIDYRLYLPKDPRPRIRTRRAKAGVPDAIDFQTKPAHRARSDRTGRRRDSVPPGVVLADAGYGADMKFQAGLLDFELSYVLGVQPNSLESGP